MFYLIMPFHGMLNHTIPCYIIQYNTLPYHLSHAILHHTMICPTKVKVNTKQYHYTHGALAIDNVLYLYHTIPCHTILYHTISYHVISCHTVLVDTPLTAILLAQPRSRSTQNSITTSMGPLPQITPGAPRWAAVC